MLLGLNRMFNHDYLPPWGFEFLLWVNCQAWWHYTHHGFNDRYEPQTPGDQGDEGSLSNQAGAGERTNRHDAEEDHEESRDPEFTSCPSHEESVFDGDTPQPLSSPAEQDRRKQKHGLPGDPSKGCLGCGPRRVIPECKPPGCGLPPGSLPRCPVSCNSADTGMSALRDSCGTKNSGTVSLLPKFDWEGDDVGQYFGELL